MKAKKLLMVVSICAICTVSAAQTNPLWQQGKVKNYLPHMTWPEVQDLLTRSDMVIIPSGSLEQHGLHLPIGTDFFHGVERAKLIAQRTDVLVAPILMPGNSGYHMGFAGSMTLSAEIIQKVYFESAQSLMSHGFRRFLFLNSHGGNRIISQYVVDRINQHESTESTMRPRQWRWSSMRLLGPTANSIAPTRVRFSIVTPAYSKLPWGSICFPAW